MRFGGFPKIGGLNGRSGMLLVMASFGIAGIAALILTRAATPVVTVEPEAGSVMVPASVVTAADASAGKALKFGSAAANGLYYTVGNKVLTPSGQVHVFKGVAMPAMSWQSGMNGELTIQQVHAVKAWGVNLVRLPLNINHWRDNKDNYRANIKTIVGWIKADGMDIMLDLHSAELPGHTGGPARMAPRQAITFWQQVATEYKNDPDIIFELFNEPHDITAGEWRDGSSEFAGFQEMYNAVRSTGAQNIVLVAGTNWAYDLSFVKTHRINGVNIMYSTHPYNGGDRIAAIQERDYGFIVTQNIAPVMLTEFGNTTDDCNALHTRTTLDYARSKGMSWVAWAYFESGDYCSFPSLIHKGALTPWGNIAKNYMAN